MEHSGVANSSQKNKHVRDSLSRHLLLEMNSTDVVICVEGTHRTGKLNRKVSGEDRVCISQDERAGDLKAKLQSKIFL